jgi:signal transduction histidine kinase
MRAQLIAHRINPEYADTTEGLPQLDHVFATLDRAITSAQVAGAVVEGGRVSAGAISGAVVLLTPDRRDLRVAYARDDVTGRVARDGYMPLSARLPLGDVVRSRQEMWLTDREQLVEAYPDCAPEDDSRAWAALPLEIDGVILGAVGWSFNREWISSYQRACLRSLAEAGGVALYRAGLFDTERSARMAAELGSYHIERQDRMIVEINSTLDGRTDVANIDKPLDHIARLTLPHLGEWCSIEVVDGDGRLRQVAAAHLDAGKERLLHRLIPPNIRARRRLTNALQMGKPLLVQSLAGDYPHVNQRQWRVLRVVGLERLMLLPLRIHGQTLGTISFASGDKTSSYSATDRAVAAEVARRCAAWLEYVHLREMADRADQAREEFVAATSHELRTPLSHIKGFVSTLRTADTAWDAATRDDFLAEIEQEADRLASLVQTMLDLSRIDSGGFDPTQRQATDVAALVQSGVNRVRSSLGQRALEIQVPTELPPVWADASQVERVIANLLDNAAKYSPTTEPIGIAAKLTGTFVAFRVEDRGLGIPAEHLERIFEPFFREPTGSYPAKPGTGLGLPICRSIIRSQRGRIWAAQRVGGGAVLAFTLPIATQLQRT